MYYGALNTLADVAHRIAVEHGWWDEDRNDGECIALMHSELSEALEALRSGNPPSEKADGFTSLEEELADLIIRVADYAGARHLDLAGAVEAKMEYNRSRPYKHGRRF